MSKQVAVPDVCNVPCSPSPLIGNWPTTRFRVVRFVDRVVRFLHNSTTPQLQRTTQYLSQPTAVPGQMPSCWRSSRMWTRTESVEDTVGHPLILLRAAPLPFSDGRAQERAVCSSVVLAGAVHFLDTTTNNSDDVRLAGLIGT
jgi:hypothetical protein